MPGAWEGVRRPTVLVYILTRELVTTRWAGNFRNLQVPPGGDITVVAGMPYDHARNTGCEAALARGFEWLFFLDDDVLIPPDGIHTLLSTKLPIVSGLYFRRHEPVLPVALMNVVGQDGKVSGRSWVSGYTPGQPFRADFVGAGCLLIHRSVLEKLKEPWFEWTSDRKDIPENMRMSEDFNFCEKARAAGYNIIVDTRVSCGHAGLSEACAPGKMVPLTLAK
jgi:hypothetical protein